MQAATTPEHTDRTDIASSGSLEARNESYREDDCGSVGQLDA